MFFHNRALLLAALAGVLGSTLATTAALAGEADFTLVNRTGYSLREVYVSPANKKNWGNDRLGSGYLDSNRNRLIKFSDKDNCVQDLMVVLDDDSSEVIWEDFDLCALNKITLRYNRKDNSVSADSE